MVTHDTGSNPFPGTGKPFFLNLTSKKNSKYFGQVSDLLSKVNLISKQWHLSIPWVINKVSTYNLQQFNHISVNTSV